MKYRLHQSYKGIIIQSSRLGLFWTIEIVDAKGAPFFYDDKQSALIDIEKLEKFLIASAQRHIVFSYDKIAEFYSHASPNIQDLMEKSALVIIDFDKAIEGGFEKLSKDIAEIYQRDSENET